MARAAGSPFTTRAWLASLPISLADCPGNAGQLAGSASQISPNPSTFDVVGGPTLAPITGLAGLPGTAVRLGSAEGGVDALDGPHATRISASNDPRNGWAGKAARRCGAVTRGIVNGRRRCRREQEEPPSRPSTTAV